MKWDARAYHDSLTPAPAARLCRSLWPGPIPGGRLALAVRTDRRGRRPRESGQPFITAAFAAVCRHQLLEDRHGGRTLTWVLTKVYRDGIKLP